MATASTPDLKLIEGLGRVEPDVRGAVCGCRGLRDERVAAFYAPRAFELALTSVPRSLHLATGDRRHT